VLDENYNQTVDVWGVGCILGEMLNQIDPQFVTNTNSSKSYELFKGSTCYPMSPCKDHTIQQDNTVIDEGDQMIKILSKIEIDQYDLSFCSDS
jgi:hypothetical protein